MGGKKDKKQEANFYIRSVPTKVKNKEGKKTGRKSPNY